MKSVYKKFYQEAYNRTGGYIPVDPLTANAHPGDMFQIRDGRMVFLGSIFNPRIIEPYETDFEAEIKLNPSGWNFSSGTSKPYSGRGSGQNPIEGEFEFSKQIIAFESEGSFNYKGNNPCCVRIANWHDIKDELIIKLTQTYYSFREVYIVTETVLLDSWTLAVAGNEKAELEIATEAENFGLVDIFGHSSSRTIQSKDIEYYHHEKNRKPSFFKAKKLIVNNDKVEVFISSLIDSRTNYYNWAKSYFPYEFYGEDGVFMHQNTMNEQASLLDMLQGNQLNPNTALSYFSWANTSLDDINKLFTTYG